MISTGGKIRKTYAELFKHLDLIDAESPSTWGPTNADYWTPYFDIVKLDKCST